MGSPYDEGLVFLSEAMARFGMTVEEAGESFIRASKTVEWDPITKTIYRKTGDHHGKPE